MKLKCIMAIPYALLAGSYVFMASACSGVEGDTDSAFIYNDGEGGLSTSVTNNLSNHLADASYTVTIGTGSSDSDTLPGLSEYRQVWDVRYNTTTPLTSGDQDKYLDYLQDGGTLFLLGENTGFTVRNNSILSFIAMAGGGTLTIPTNSGNTQTVLGTVATTPNDLPTITFLAAGGFASAGTGTCLTIDGNGNCAAIGFGAHTLSNAMSGSLVSVLDVNFLDRTSDAASEAFISNLIQYLDTQAEIGEQPLSIFVPVSNGITNGVAQTLDGLLLDSIIDVDMAAAVGELSSLSDAQRATAMNRLTPDASNAQLQLGYQATSAGLSNIETRLDGIRNAGALARGKQNYENVRVASAGSLKGVLEAKELKHGAWGKFFGGEMSQDAQDGYAGYSANTWGLTFGLDTRLSQGTTVGIALAYSDSDLDNEDFLNGSQNDMEHEQITGYFDHDFGPWYLDGFLSYALLNYSSVRDTGVTGIASGDYDGDIFAVKVDAGIPFALSATVAVTPFASLEYDHLSVDGYTETGAGPLNLTVNENSADRLRSGLGIRLSNDMEFKGMHVRPSLHVQWLHNFENDGIATTAGFEGGGAEFTTPGQDIEENTGNIGANLLFTVGKNSALSVRYDYEAGGEFESHSGQLVYQLWF